MTLGNFATKFVLKTETGITRLHGTVQEAGRFTVLPIFHPAAAIYDRTKRDALFADFELLGRLLADKAEGASASVAEAASEPARPDEPEPPRAPAAPADVAPDASAGAPSDSAAEQTRLF